MRHLLLCLSLALSLLVAGQSLEQWTQWGDAAMARGEYYGATRFYEGALRLDGGRMSLQWKHAEASRLSNQYDKAAEHYGRVYQKDQGRTYPDALRWLAEMQMSEGAYEEAMKSWNRLLQRERKKDSFNALRAEQGLKGCDLALTLKEVEPAHEPTHLPQPVNSHDSEFGPRIGPDEQLYFSALRGEVNKDGEVKDTADYRTRIYHAAPSGNAWNDPVPAGTAINEEGHNANITWSLDGNRIYFTRCLNDTPCRIHVSTPGPEEASPFPLAGLGEEMSTQPQIVRWNEREMLIFVSDRVGGAGGHDIWQAEIIEGNAHHVHPVNGGVNSIGDERTPWFDLATNTLYFSSNFHPGLGGHDLFTTTVRDDVFSAPVNMGLPFNSPANDLYPHIDPDQTHFWFASNRKGSLAAKGETCCSDIYRVPLTEEQRPLAMVDLPLDTLAGGPSTTSTPGQTPTAADAQDREAIASIQRRFPITLYFHNDDPDPRSWATRTGQTYEETYKRYRSLLPEYERQKMGRERLQAFFNEYVEGGRALLTELIDVLIPALERGEEITLVVRGHASPLAESDYNQNLSLRRISSLRNHLRITRDGVLLPYLDGSAEGDGRLHIREMPFGEERAAEGVSDDLKDLPSSVYSIEAMRERRIEIEALLVMPRQASSEIEELLESAGELPQDRQSEVIFTLKNEGTRPLKLTESIADCGCTTAALPDAPIPPGGSTEVKILFNGRAPLGVISRTVTILTDGEPGRYRLTMEGVVVQ